MKKIFFIIILNLVTHLASAQYDWDGIMVPPSPGAGMVWELQDTVSDDFNYYSAPSNFPNTINGKWINWYHNNWSGPLPTKWRRDHVNVENGYMKIISSRTAGDSVTVSGQRLATTNLGCATSTTKVQYPVYVEAQVKIMKSVLASDVWLLSGDDTQEIDICEAYGSSRWTNAWFSDKRVHLSHHVFIRQPFQDWQPSDAGSFYTDGTTVWSDAYHRIGVYWKDPWNLEYYIDGQLVRTRSGKDQIDPVFFTNAINPGDVTSDTRTGLSKPMDIIINTEDQTWRALQGLTPTDAELADTTANTFKVDWIRVYKPTPGNVGPVTAVEVTPPTASYFLGNQFTVQANITPYNANDLSVTWSSDNPNIATVDTNGLVTCLSGGTVNIIATTNENQKTDTCILTVINAQAAVPTVEFDDEAKYLNTDFEQGKTLEVTCNFHAGSNNTVVDNSFGGVKFWLREIEPGWSVANDYVMSDPSAIGKEQGTATATISLEGVPTTAELPSGNWYFLYVTFENSEGDFVDYGIYPINIVEEIIDTVQVDSTFKVYPNPTNSILNIQSEELADGDYPVRIFTTTGQLVENSTVTASELKLALNVAKLPRGFYIVRLELEEPIVVRFFKY